MKRNFNFCLNIMKKNVMIIEKKYIDRILGKSIFIE